MNLRAPTREGSRGTYETRESGHLREKGVEAITREGSRGTYERRKSGHLREMGRDFLVMKVKILSGKLKESRLIFGDVQRKTLQAVFNYKILYFSHDLSVSIS